MNEKDPAGKYSCHNHEIKRKVVDEGFVAANSPAVKAADRTLYIVEPVALKI